MPGQRGFRLYSECRGSEKKSAHLVRIGEPRPVGLEPPRNDMSVYEHAIESNRPRPVCQSSAERARADTPTSASPASTSIRLTSRSRCADRTETGPVSASGAGGRPPSATCRHHGGDDQAVYAYAREYLDSWAAAARPAPLANGIFGENLTTAGIDVTGALIGERWRLGDAVLLEVSAPPDPVSHLRRLARRAGLDQDVHRGALPGAYLRVIEPGPSRGGDPLAVIHRPGHDPTIVLSVP